MDRELSFNMFFDLIFKRLALFYDPDLEFYILTRVNQIYYHLDTFKKKYHLKIFLVKLCFSVIHIVFELVKLIESHQMNF